jgi:excisionase family DNA binding protein
MALMSANAEQREYLAPKEVAHELRVHVSSIYRAIESGHLPAVRLSEHGAIRIPREAIVATKEKP